MTNAPRDARVGLLELRSADQASLGSPVEVFADPESGQPLWAGVLLGRLRPRIAVVPLFGADVRDDVVELPYTRAQIEAAPVPARPHELTPAEQETIGAYYADATGDVA